MALAFRRVHYKPFLYTLAVLGFTPLFAYAQNSALVTSGMGGGASSTARMTAVQTQHKARIDNIEVCGNKARIWGADFTGSKDGDDCLTGVTLTPTGRFGVGTAGPSEVLHVNGSGRIHNLRIGDVGHGTGWMGIGHDAIADTGGNYAVIQNSTGFTLFNSASGQNMEFRIGNGTQMILTSAGNFGIGTSPAAKLHVNGTLRSNGALTIAAGGASVAGNASFANNVSVAGSTTSQTYYHTSDRRLKDNISALENSADLIMQLKPVRFNWKTDNRKSMGFIAQEIEEILPEAVTESQVGFKAVNYDILTAPIIAMLQSQQEQLRAQEAEIQLLKEALAGLKGDGGN